MLSISNLLCSHTAGNERLRYGHRSEAGSPRPVVVWAVTRACNLRCVHCYASATPRPTPGELTQAEGFAILEDLKAFDVPAVLFSGGEPLARPDTLELISRAQALELACTVSTNGTLIDERMADRLAELGLRYVGISLDGAREKHDGLRGQAGAFDRALAAADRCRERGIRVGLRFTVHALNEDDLDTVFDLCLAHDIQRLCVYHLAYAGRGGKMQKVDLAPDKTRRVVDRVFERTRRCHADRCPLEVLTVDNHADAAYLLLRLEEEAARERSSIAAAPAAASPLSVAAEPPHGPSNRYRRRDFPGRAAYGGDLDAASSPSAADRLALAALKLVGTGGNRSGCNIAAIDPLGGVHYDQFSWHYDCGNVRREPFSRIWSAASDPRLAILRDRRAHLPGRCRHCRFLGVCNGNLRTRAEAATGDWLGMDPSCYLTDHERSDGPVYR